MKPAKVLLLIILFSILPYAWAKDDLPGAGITPDSPLYGLDRAFERINLILTFDVAKKSERRLQNAAERLAELQVLVNKGSESDVEELVEDYFETLEAAEDLAVKTQSPEKRELLKKRITSVSTEHYLILNSLDSKLPPRAKEKIKNARAGSQKKSGPNEISNRLEKAGDTVRVKKTEAEKKSDAILESLSDRIAKKIKKDVYSDDETAP